MKIGIKTWINRALFFLVPSIIVGYFAITSENNSKDIEMPASYEKVNARCYVVKEQLSKRDSNTELQRVYVDQEPFGDIDYIAIRTFEKDKGISWNRNASWATEEDREEFGKLEKKFNQD